MTLMQIIFYTLSVIAIFSSVMVIAAKNTVHGALFLVLTFFAMACMWVLLQAEFLALILVVVYVGAVMTLFLFVVMMLSLDNIGRREGFVNYLPFGIIIVLLVIGMAIMVLGPKQFGISIIPAPADVAADYSNTASLGMVLYTNYAYPFEVAAVLLLTAIIAAISLTHHRRKRHKSQHIPHQINVNPKDRMRIVKMASEPKISPQTGGTD